MTFFTFWIFALVAVTYSGLAAWRISLGRGRTRAPFLALAFLSMAVSAGIALANRVEWFAFRELFRNLAWLIYLHVATRASVSEKTNRWLLKFGYLLVVLLCLSVGTNILSLEAEGLVSQSSLIIATLALRLTFSFLGVIFVHNLYRASPPTNTGFRIILIALGIRWAYDVNLYTVTLLGYDATTPLLTGQALLALLLVPVFAIGARRKENWQIALSRKATFQTLTVIALGMYFIAMAAIARVGVWLRGDLGPVLALTAGVLVSSLGLYFLLSSHGRAWLKVILTKHLFKHRYDYREEWLRFSATIGEAATSFSIEEKVVKSVAEILDAPAGLLLMVEGENQFCPTAQWNWPGRVLRQTALSLPAALLDQLEAGRVITPSELRATAADISNTGNWPATREETWIIVPLIRLRSLIGIIMLARPQLDRDLDWEDFDLLKVVGQQAAVHIADAQRETELEESRRFDEFNRRFAFIIHDIKNVVSQLSLLASNAREHGANPQFQADMAESLANAVQKMNGLLSKLATDRTVHSTIMQSVSVHDLLRDIAQGRVHQHPIILHNVEDVWVVADKEKLGLALEHLTQNAIEASPAASPIYLSSQARDGRGVISIADQGHGMSAEFIRKHLFKPFVSTKAGGFGIGAAESRALVNSMGGTLTVNSVEGEGSLFTIGLPLCREGDAAQG